MSPRDRLLREVSRCFTSNGPFFTAIAEAKQGAEIRSEQQTFAEDLAEYLVCGITDEQFAAVEKGERPPLYLGDIAPGIGKTLVYTMVAALKARVFSQQVRHRTIISTFTRQLRAEIVSEGNVIVNRAMELMGLAPAIIRPYVALTGACSLEHATNLAEQHVHALPYLDFVRESYERGELPMLPDFFAQGGDLDFMFGTNLSPADTQHDVLDLLTVRVSELSRVRKHITSKQRKGLPLSREEKAFYDQHQRNVEAREDADLLVVTHALLTQNAINFGTILRTNKMQVGKFEPTTDRFDVIIDEADLYHEQALNWFDADIPLKRIDDALGSRGRRAFKSLRNFLQHKTTMTYNFDSNAEKEEIVGLIKPIMAAIDRRSESEFEVGSMECDHLEKVRRDLDTVVRWYQDVGKCTAACTASDADTSLMSVRRRDELALTLQARDGGRVANRLWRNINLHAFDHVALISGTLTGCDRDSIDHFKRLTGIFDTDKHSNDAVWRRSGSRRNPSLSIDHRQSNRSIARVVFADNDLRPYDSETKELDDDYWTYIAETVRDCILRPSIDKNTLVLLTSFRTLDFMKDYFRNFQGVLFQRPSGAESSLKDARGAVERNEKFVLFGLNWMGVNYVHAGKTMIDRVVFPVVPYPVKRVLDPHYHASYEDSASRSLRQGMGRALRTAGDRPELWFLDPRLGLPTTLAPLQSSKLTDSLFADLPFEEAHILRDSGFHPLPIRDVA